MKKLPAFIWRPLYLLQLENYDLSRFLRSYFNSRTLLKIPRSEIIWTPKLLTIASISFFLSVIILLGIVGVIYTYFNFYFAFPIFLFIIIGLLFLHKIYIYIVLVAAWMIYPLDAMTKYMLLKRAKQKLLKHPSLIVVGITGSYGKTTMKEIVTTLSKESLTVLATPENINTPIGISRLILRELKPETKILIVEMGAYHRGDIAKLCALVQPDISILTGINESHLERFGSMKNTIATKFEIVGGTKKNGVVILNADDSLILENYMNYVGQKKVLFFSAQNHPLAHYRTANIHFHTDGTGISFTLQQSNNSLLPYRIPYLGEYAIGTLMGAIIVVEYLGIHKKDILFGTSRLKPVPHRLQPIQKNDILVIDDSYNGNPQGIGEAIRVLERFVLRRKVFVTPGLVEMGIKTKEIHHTIGRLLGKVADLVILIKNSTTPYIAEGLLSVGYSQENILWFQNSQEAYVSLKTIIKAGDVVLLQNDWPDNYF